MKPLLRCSLLFLMLAACKKEEPDVIKLDYTGLYESAAYALASARENYDRAVKSNDTAAIRAAKIRLARAENSYKETKGNLQSGEENALNITVVKPGNDLNAAPAGTQPANAPAPMAEMKVPSTTESKESDRKKARKDSMTAVRKANYEAFKAKAKSDLQKDTVRVRLQRFNKQVKDFFEGKPAK